MKWPNRCVFRAALETEGEAFTLFSDLCLIRNVVFKQRPILKNSLYTDSICCILFHVQRKHAVLYFYFSFVRMQYGGTLMKADTECCCTSFFYYYHYYYVLFLRMYGTVSMEPERLAGCYFIFVI